MGYEDGGGALDEPDAFLGARGGRRNGERSTAGFYGEVYTEDLHFSSLAAVHVAVARFSAERLPSTHLLMQTGASVKERGLLR